jgi:acetyl-CoA carboxylase biotin carboxyl carrier protein
MTTPETEIPEAVTYREVSELLRTFAASGWTGLTLRVDSMTITIGRHGPPATAAPPAAAPPAAAPPPTPPSAAAPPPTASPATEPPATGSTDLSGCVPVKSPAVGAFWVAPQPGAPPFAEVGHTVAEGDQLAIVEVMKLMNPVLASQAGEIAEVCATDAELVEYDQVLFWIRPTGPGEPAGG